MVRDDISRPFLRASNENPYTGTSYAIAHVGGTFDVFNPFGCSANVQENQTDVKIDARCHDMISR